MNYIPLKYVTNLYGIASVSALLSNQDVSDHNTNNYAMLLDSGLLDSGLLDSGLLDSGNAGAEKNSLKSSTKFNNAGYDIFCSHPCLTLTKPKTSNGYIEIDKLSSSLAQVEIDNKEQDPLKQMRDILEQVRQQSKYKANSKTVSKQESDLPFNGGWLGYFSYDFGKSLELADQTKSLDNDVPLCRFGLYRWAIISDHKKRTSRLYNFGLTDEEWQNIKSLFDNENFPKRDIVKNTEHQFELIRPFKSNVSFKKYSRSFSAIQKHILAGDCYQINYAQQFTTSFKGCSFEAYQQLTKVNKSPFSAYLNFGDFQILSLSPERFIQVKNRKVLTQPIKGTSPRSVDKKIDQQNANNLLSSEKDRSENLMIVDLMRNDLSKTADTASVKVPELFGLYSFESVHHLISTVTSQLAPEYDMFDILQTCLPGGSITGAPKIAAMKIIDELEDFNRGIYCGIIGYMDFKGNMDTNICIRTLLAKNNELTCCAGGGIVYDSNVESEYQETYHKVSKIIPVLENAILNQSHDNKSMKEHG